MQRIASYYKSSRSRELKEYQQKTKRQKLQGDTEIRQHYILSVYQKVCLKVCAPHESCLFRLEKLNCLVSKMKSFIVPDEF